jgi:DNA-binding PadR family transcriptional regulator
VQTFLTKERAILKVCLIHEIEKSPSYGWAYHSTIAEQIPGFKPSKSEIYKSLHELAAADIVKRSRRKRNDEGLQEIIVYTFTSGGYAKAQRYKKLVYDDLIRSQTMIKHFLSTIF